VTTFIQATTGTRLFSSGNPELRYEMVC